MPVPESSYSRRYGRESSYSTYSSINSSSGPGRSSYLSSYSSKQSSSLPPRPPAYDLRKYTDSALGSGSRFLSSSANRSRDYGSSTSSSNYRSSVSPVRGTASSIRRQLESTAPSIAERIKAMEIGEKDEAPPSRTSRYSSLRSRDTPLNKSTYTSSTYGRDRSGSREFGSSPLTSMASSAFNRGDSAKSSSENLRGRASPTGSNPQSAPLSRSGSGGGGHTRNGVGHRGSTTEVNSPSSSSATSASESVTVATTTNTTNKPVANVATDTTVDDEKCAKDVENNDSDSLGSSCSASSSVSVSYSDTSSSGLGISSNNMNGHGEKKRLLPSVPPVKINRDSKDKSMEKEMRGPLINDSLPPPPQSTPAVVVDKDSNGNPISMEIPKGKGIDISAPRADKVISGRSSSPVERPQGAQDSCSLVKKCESDSNANNILREASSTSVTPSTVTCNGEANSKEKSPFEVVIKYKPKSTLASFSLSPSNSAKNLGQNPKVVYHTIQVEESNKEVSPEPVSYTIRSRPSLDGSQRQIEIQSVTPQSVSADFKVTLPKLRTSSGETLTSENGHNNKDLDLSDHVTVDKNKVILKEAEESIHKKSREYTPEVFEKSKKVASRIERSPTPKAAVKKSDPVTSSQSRNSSREVTPTVTKSAPKSISPSPDKQLSSSSYTKTGVKLSNGDVDNINTAEMMGPHSSKYNCSPGSSCVRDSPQHQRNDRERGGRYANLTAAASDSSDNDSDAYSSSSHVGRFRSSKDASSKDAFEKAGLTGLRNIGNTCFMNTVLQCLSNTKPLLEYVMKDNYEADINKTQSGMKGALIRAFGDVIRELWREQRVVDTSAFKDQIQRFAPRFMGYSQQDAQEFLRYLLEGLHEDVNRVTSKPTPILTDIDDSLSDNEKAAESWKRYLRYESSKIVDIFVGQFKSTLKCTVCGHCSVTFDPFWDLSLPIPSRSSNIKLSQCFELFSKEEVLDGDEKPTCAKCQCRRKCTKSLAIQKLPKILVIHLKRFSLAERYRGKLSTLVDYPLTGLDLSPFAATRGQSCGYNLYGIANHSGSTYSGHYIAYCKHPYTGEWHCYNDSRVSPISPHSVVSSEGYVLFYEQSGQ